MKYRKGFKYQLAENLILQTTFRPQADVLTKFVVLRISGQLELLEGFCFDGPSGPVIDRRENMRGAAGHDGLYRLMRKGLIDHKRWREADLLFGKWIRQDGAWAFTEWVYVKGLSLAQGSAANPRNIAVVHET